MKYINTIILFMIGTIISFYGKTQNEGLTERLKRKDSYFGVHLDLHATENILNAGESLTEEMIDTFLTTVRPDYIQVDCKGHAGISSYPTKIGFPVKGFEKDPLKLFRKVTAKNNVALYVHFSGVIDQRVVEEHPEWAVIKEDGTPSKGNSSFFSPYLETYMIPQLKELSDYGVDGAWIDGECWAVEPDYGNLSVMQFKHETGINEIPLKSTDKYFPEFLEYTRRLFRKHMNDYIDAIHQYNPNFQITSNWAFTSLMPEKVTAGVDFLSGDVNPQNGIYRSAFESRCVASQGLTWDLMVWGFSWNEKDMPWNIKSPVQIKQEIAQILAMGGGAQVYFKQNRDLSIKPWLNKTLAEVSHFCHQRQLFCHKALPVPQLALVYPTAYYQKTAQRPYHYPTNELEGALNLILDNQLPVEILMEHTLSGSMGKYPLIIIPECDYFEHPFMLELEKYVNEGGNLLILGTKTAGLFEKKLGIKILEKKPLGEAFIAASDQIGTIRTTLISIESNQNIKVTSRFYETTDFRYQGNHISSSINKSGKGLIAAVYFDAGNAYYHYKSPVLRDFIGLRIAELFPNPIVQVSGSRLIHVTTNILNDKMYVNLLNIAGEHTNANAIGYDEVPFLNNIFVTINTGNSPKKILLQPENEELEFRFEKGFTKVLLEELHLHSIIEILP